MFLRRPLLGLLVALCAQAVDAETLESCRSKPQPERLQCYDDLADKTLAKAENPAATGDTPASAYTTAGSSMLTRSWSLDNSDILLIRPYKPVYALPGFYTSRTNRTPSSPAAGHSQTSGDSQNNTEAKLQISLKTRLLDNIFGDNGDLWFGYTQTSRWQVYNSHISRPFRETNHEPEAIFVWRTDIPLGGGWQNRFWSLGINHQSNGRSLPLSRSWNRVIAAIGVENDNWAITLRPWWRVPESRADDDNPDIANYLGRADLLVVRRWGKGHQFSALLRHNLQFGNGSRGAAQLDYAFRIAGNLHGHLQWFSGYGESMIDYNHRANYYGIGVSLVEWD